MSSWNTGPFDNDQAADFLDMLGEMSPEEKTSTLAELFAHAVADPDGSERFLPIQKVVAGAAIVALRLPGGESVLDFQKANVSEELAAALPVPCDREIVGSAREAVLVVTQPHRVWSWKWLNEGDRADAHRGVDEIVRVLTANLSPGHE